MNPWQALAQRLTWRDATAAEVRAARRASNRIVTYTFHYKVIGY